MTQRPADLVALRSRRKQDLLLASALARHQAAGAIGQISQRVDGVVGVYLQLRSWRLASRLPPLAGVLAAVAALAALRRVRIFRLLRWGLIGWRVARVVTGLRGARRAGD